MKIVILFISASFFSLKISFAQDVIYQNPSTLNIGDFYPSQISDVVSHGENLIITDHKLGLVSINLKTLMVEKTLSEGGRGPGEFINISNIHLGKHSNKLLVLDSSLYRISFFSIDNLIFQESFLLPNLTNVDKKDGLFWPRQIWEVSIDNNINYIVLYDQAFTIKTEMEKRKKKLVLFDRFFNVIDDEFLELKGDYEFLQIKKWGGYEVTRRLFGVKNLIDFTSDGKAVQCWTEFPCLLVENEEQCLRVDQLEVTENDLKLINQNIEVHESIDLVSYIEKTFPFFDDMYVYKSDDSNPDLIWLSRNKGVQELELIEYSLSAKKIVRTIIIPGWFKLLKVSDTSAYIITHPKSNANPQILEVSLD